MSMTGASRARPGDRLCITYVGRTNDEEERRRRRSLFVFSGYYRGTQGARC